MLLLIPGPVTTRPEVRAAMALDYAPWDNDIRTVLVDIRRRVVAIAGGVDGLHAALPLQGCGHFATEAALRSFLPQGGRILVAGTGAYAERMIKLGREAGRDVVVLPVPEERPVDPQAVADALAADPGISHVGLVYSETGSGVIHDPAAVGAVVRAAGRRMILDAVSAFGALPLNLAAQPEIDAVVFTTNKCLEGLPGMAITIARIDRLQPGLAGSWSFDLADVWAQVVRSGSGSFRFTPAIQAVMAFAVALDIYDAEGGQPARLARYRANADTLYDGMSAIGLAPCLSRALQGSIVMNIAAPADPAWVLQNFVDALKRRGYLISNFFNTKQPQFPRRLHRRHHADDMRGFTKAVDASLTEMGIGNRLPARNAA